MLIGAEVDEVTRTEINSGNTESDPDTESDEYWQSCEKIDKGRSKKQTKEELIHLMLTQICIVVIMEHHLRQNL